MTNENSNGVEPPQQAEDKEVAPKAQSESAESLDLANSTLDLQKARSDSKNSLKGDLGQVKFTKNPDDSVVVVESGEVAFTGMGRDELMKYANDPFWVRLRWSLFILFWLAWLGMLVGAIVIVVLAPKCPAPPPLEYWQKGAIYAVEPKSFQDTGAFKDTQGHNVGPDTGDIKGIVARLDHFVHLGVNMILLSPVFTEDMISEALYGHTVTNFTDIDPLFGNLEDFKDLVKAAKAKDLKVVLDLVPNHSSEKHPWFNKSRASDPTYKDYYIWKDGKGAGLPPNNWATIFGDSSWTFDSGRKQYYYHKYGSKQPDLNLRNPAVREEILNVVRFWLDQGVSGFRLLSVPYLFENEDVSLDDNSEQTMTKNLNDSYNFVSSIRAILQKYEDDDGDHRVLLVEAEDSTTDGVLKYYGAKDAPLADLPVNTNLIKNIKRGFTASDLRMVIKEFNQAIANMSKPDENVNVEGVSTLWAWPTWLLGDKDNSRLASRLEQPLIDGMAIVQMLLPGTPIIYYGEEIGMEDVSAVKPPNAGECPSKGFNCNQVRTPMRWKDSALAGFTNGSNPWQPIGDNVEQINVETQMAQTNSHLNIYRALMTLRMKQPAIMHGTLSFPEVDNADIFAYTRIRKGAPGYLVVLNLSDKEQTVDFSVDKSIGHDAQVVISSSANTTTTNKVETKNIVIGPKEGQVLSFVPDFSSK